MSLDGSATNDYTGATRTSCQPTEKARRSCGCLPARRWYVVRACTGQAYHAELALSADGWRVYFPQHLHRVAGRAPRIVPLFNPYLFVEFDITADHWAAICHTRGVAALLHAGGKPAPVSPACVEELMARTSARRIVDDPLNYGVTRHIPQEALVDVMDGPMLGMRGVCRLPGPERCRVLLSLLGRQVEMDIPTKDLELA